MGMADAFRDVAQTIVKAFDDVPVSTNVKFFGSTAYNASSGVFTTTYSTTLCGVKAVFTVFRVEQIDGQNVVASDRRVLIAANDLETQQTGIKERLIPKINDVIVQADPASPNFGDWNIQDVLTDPAAALYRCHVRKS